ncbi:MAG: pyridoxal phosphate-dependent decarboxylase family protein [Hyphomicrobiales bacterium]
MSNADRGLDPEDWTAIREIGHRMLDDAIDYIETLRDRPVWKPMPAEVRAEIHAPLPRKGAELADVYAEFLRLVVPYSLGNAHPRFMGWVHGGGTVVGMLAELLSASLNNNLGGRDHAAIEVEREVIRWTAEMMGFPSEASGVLVTGTSIANLIGILVARTVALGASVRKTGLAGSRLTAYASSAAHNCVSRAIDMVGLGSDALRLVAADAEGRMDVAILQEQIAADRRAGFIPFLIVGTAGTVDTGAIDDLDALALLAEREKIWFHIDGAFGALCVLTPRLKPLVFGIERADSIALDFHKWAQVQYDAGLILVRDRAAHAATFASPATYLAREVRGLAAGHPWPVDFGPDLSRGFRALKVWMTLKTYGAERIGEAIEHSCDLARRLGKRVEREAELELLAPVRLNIVCFRFRAGPGHELDLLNREIVADLQETGIAVPSTTVLDGKLAIRAALINHRIGWDDLEALVAGVLNFGRRRVGAPG